MLIVLLVLAIIIVVALSGYAISLQARLTRVKKEQQQALQLAEQNLRSHQEKLINDIRFVVRAMLANQCEITEGVLRLNFLIHSLDPEVWEHISLPTLRLHHQQTGDMPILNTYQALSKQQQFELDNARYQYENSNKDALMPELEWLLSYRFPNVTLVDGSAKQA